MIDLLSLVPLQQTSPAVSTDLSAPVEQDFSALLNELVAPAEQAELTQASLVALPDGGNTSLPESPVIKNRDKENVLSPTNLLAPLPSAGLFFESQVFSPDLKQSPQAIPVSPATTDDDFTRSVLNDLKKFEVTVHYEVSDSVQPAPKQAMVTSDLFASMQQLQQAASFTDSQLQPQQLARSTDSQRQPQHPARFTDSQRQPQHPARFTDSQRQPQQLPRFIDSQLQSQQLPRFIDSQLQSQQLARFIDSQLQPRQPARFIDSQLQPQQPVRFSDSQRQQLARFTDLQPQPQQLLPRSVDPPPQQARMPALPQLIQNAAVGSSEPTAIGKTALEEEPRAVEVQSTAGEENPAVVATLPCPQSVPTPAPALLRRVWTDLNRVENKVELSEPSGTLNVIPPEQTEQPSSPLITTDPIAGLALTRPSAGVIAMLQTTADLKAQLKTPVAPAPTNVLTSQQTSQTDPVNAGERNTVVRPFVLDSVAAKSPDAASSDSARSILKDIKRVEIKPRAASLLSPEELIAEATEKKAVVVESSESDLQPLPLSSAILPSEEFVNAKQVRQNKADSGAPKSSDSSSPASVIHFDNRSRSVDVVEQPRTAHWVEIPHMPKLQVVRTVSMELGDAGSEVAVRIQDREGGMTLHFGTGNDSLQHSIESSVGVLVHALKQEQVQLSNVEVTRKSPIEKVRRMKEAR